MIDVHTEHCCKDHGCKYRDADCTVVTGAGVQADYACEECYIQKLEGLEFGENSDEPIELVRGEMFGPIESRFRFLVSNRLGSEYTKSRWFRAAQKLIEIWGDESFDCGRTAESRPCTCHPTTVSPDYAIGCPTHDPSIARVTPADWQKLDAAKQELDVIGERLTAIRQKFNLDKEVESPVINREPYGVGYNLPQLEEDWTWQKLDDAITSAPTVAGQWKAVALRLTAELEGLRKQNRELHQSIAKQKAKAAEVAIASAPEEYPADLGLREAAQLIYQMTEFYQHSADGRRALDDVRGAILKRAGRDPEEQGLYQYLGPDPVRKKS